MKRKAIYLNSCFILVLLLSPSCKLSREQRKYIGKWESRESHINYFLKIYRNGKYKHRTVCFCPKLESYGTWKIVNDTLVLTQNKFVTNSPNERVPKGDTLFKKIILVAHINDKEYVFKKDYLREIRNGKRVHILSRP